MSHSGHRGQTTTLSNRVPVRHFLQESVKKINDLRNVTFQQASGGRRTTPSPERLRLRKEWTRTGGTGERAARPFRGSSHSQVGGAGSEASTRLTLKRLACRDGKPKRDTWPQNRSVTRQARDEGRRAPGPCGQLPRRLPASTHSHPPVTAAAHPLRASHRGRPHTHRRRGSRRRRLPAAFPETGFQLHLSSHLSPIPLWVSFPCTLKAPFPPTRDLQP